MPAVAGTTKETAGAAPAVAGVTPAVAGMTKETAGAAPATFEMT